jgi:hypothetical protein
LVLLWIVPNLPASITLVYVYQITSIVLSGLQVQVTSRRELLCSLGVG